MKEVNSFRTPIQKSVLWPRCERPKLQLSFYDEYDDEESFYDDFSRGEDEESEQMRIERLIAERIADAKARFQDRYSDDNYYHHPSAEEFRSERILSREDRVNELNRIAMERARAERIQAMRAALEEERRIEAERVQDEAMAAERVRLEAQQRKRDIEKKREAAEKARAERAKESEKNKGRKEFIDVDFEIIGNKKPDHYHSLITDGMAFATEKAEKFISEEESRVAEETRLSSRDPRRYKKIMASPKQLLGRIAVEESRIREERLLAMEILEEAKIASQLAREEADATELVRLSAVQSEAERIIEEKNHELAIIEKEKKLASEIVDEMERRNY